MILSDYFGCQACITTHSLFAGNSNVELGIPDLAPNCSATSIMVAKLDAPDSIAVVIRAATVLDDGAILASYGLERDSSGVISWAPGSPFHPRHWPISRKVYDTALIIMLELYT